MAMLVSPVVTIMARQYGIPCFNVYGRYLLNRRHYYSIIGNLDSTSGTLFKEYSGLSVGFTYIPSITIVSL